MDAAGLGEDIGTDNGGVLGNALAGEVLHHLTQAHQMALIHIELAFEIIAQIHHHLRQGGVTGTLPQAVESAVDAGGTLFGRREGIGRGQAVVVVGVEVETCLGEALAHIGETGRHLGGGHHPQGVGQHKMANGGILQGLDQGVDILRAVAVAVGPVLQVEIDIQA